MFAICRHVAVSLFCFASGHAVCQSLKPGLSGMAPSKWLTFRNTHSPGKVYSFKNTGEKKYTYEEYFVRAWVPAVNTKNVKILLGPSYRTEQLESKSGGENPIRNLEGWNLRSYALDVNSLVKLDSMSWIIATSHFNKSGNVAELSLNQIPLNYTVSASFLRKRSASKELGVGIMLNRSYKLTVLPVVIFNYNFSERLGVEMMLPKRAALRHNLSRNDILYLRAESVTRTYYTNSNGGMTPDVCRRVDVDLGLTYNRRIGSWVGAEISAGYRKNLSTRLIDGALAVRPSGLAMTLDVYVQPPKFKGKK